jgi:hypothetical protein
VIKVDEISPLLEQDFQNKYIREFKYKRDAAKKNSVGSGLLLEVKKVQ